MAAALPPATLFDQVAPVVEEGVSLTAVRARIKKLQESVAVLKRVPIPAPDIPQKVQSYVRGLTRPIIGGVDAGEVLTVQWPTELHVLMAFLQPEVLVERLMAEINRIANTPCALPEREQQIAELEVRLTGYSAPRRPLLWPQVRHANADARHGSCWVSRP